MRHLMQVVVPPAGRRQQHTHTFAARPRCHDMHQQQLPASSVDCAVRRQQLRSPRIIVDVACYCQHRGAGGICKSLQHLGMAPVMTYVTRVQEQVCALEGCGGGLRGVRWQWIKPRCVHWGVVLPMQPLPHSQDRTRRACLRAALAGCRSFGLVCCSDAVLGFQSLVHWVALSLES